MAATTTTGGVQVDVERIEWAATVLAGAEGRNWESAEVRNRYRGLALATVGAYLARVGSGDGEIGSLTVDGAGVEPEVGSLQAAPAARPACDRCGADLDEAVGA